MKTFIDYLTEYYPKAIQPNHMNSMAIRHFKNGNPKSIAYFQKILNSWIESEIVHNEAPLTHFICAIPSCNHKKINTITKLAQDTAAIYPVIKPATQFITKRYTTQSLCRTGYRNHEKFIKSFEISPDVKSKHILLIDDVTTTGYSFRILERLLLNLGATSVTCLALAQTIYINSFNNQ